MLASAGEEQASGFDNRPERVQDGNGDFRAGFLVGFEAQVLERDGFKIEFDGLLLQLFKVFAELLEVRIRRAETARAAGVVINERILGAMEIRNRRLQPALRARQQPARGVRQFVAFENADGLAFNDLHEVQAVQMGDCFAEREDLLIGEDHNFFVINLSLWFKKPPRPNSTS